MNSNFINSKILYLISCLLFINSINAKINPQQGENLWRLIARIGNCADVADLKLDLLESQNDAICSKLENFAPIVNLVDGDISPLFSKADQIADDLTIHNKTICIKIEKVDDELAIHNDIVCSKLESFLPLFDGVGESVDIVGSRVEVVDDGITLLCSKIEKVDDDLVTHNDIVCSKLENVTSLVEKVDSDLTTQLELTESVLEIVESVVDEIDNNLTTICSKIEKVDDDLVTHSGIVCSKLENITSKIDELEFVGTCETLIFQSDIPFTIDSPGVYCLVESVTFATGTAITIASDNVLFDLNEKKIDGSAGGSIGVAINSGLSNITIQNGTLCNMNDKGIDADATNNIAFISMSLLDSLVDMPVCIAPITCLQIKDIKVLNVGIFKEFPIISVVDSLIDSVVDIPDCILSPITGININCATKVILDNCQALCCLGDGFALQMVENGTIESCKAEENGGNGFVLDNVDMTCLKWCKANMNCLHGVCDSACNGDNFYLGCIAKQNGIHGFNIAGGGKVVQECVASQNTRDGFNLSTSLLNDADLDPTFGDGGIFIGYAVGANDSFNAAALQKDGKIVIAGNVIDPVRFVVIRLTAEGSFDPTFGTGGIVTTAFNVGDDVGNAVAIQKNGKIVVAGTAFIGGGNDFGVARYNTDGSLDVSFGTGGLVTTDFSGFEDVGRAVAIQKDGKIVVAGQSDAGVGTDFAVARYNTDGSLDTSFGTGGLVTTDLSLNDSGNAVALQKDGKIVVAGGSSAGVTFDFAVARYNTDGSLDVTFNPTGSLPGTVTTDFTGGSDRGNAVTIQKDGKIVVAGFASGDFAVARYNTDGSLDVSFGTGGKVTTDFGGTDRGNAVALQKDGKIVVAGRSNAEGINDFAVARYNTDGNLDITFNPTGSLQGTVITNLEGTDRGRAVAIQKDGKIVVVGDADDSELGVVRYVVFKQGVVVKDCVAQENGEDGFNIAGSAYEISNSSAIHNAVNGFLLKSLTDGCQLLSNKALKNNNIGIENLGTDNQILNNRSHKNTSSNYAGVALVATPTSTTGFWENVEA